MPPTRFTELGRAKPSVRALASPPTPAAPRGRRFLPPAAQDTHLTIDVLLSADVECLTTGRNSTLSCISAIRRADDAQLLGWTDRRPRPPQGRADSARRGCR